MKYKNVSIISLLLFGLFLSSCGCKNDAPSNDNSTKDSIEHSLSHEDNSMASDISHLESIVISETHTK